MKKLNRLFMLFIVRPVFYVWFWNMMVGLVLVGCYGIYRFVECLNL